MYLPAFLEDAGLVTSRSEARRLIKQGAVKLAGSKISAETVPAAAMKGQVVQVGKRRFIQVGA